MRVIVIFALLICCCQSVAISAKAAQTAQKGVLVEIEGDFSHDDLEEIRGLAELAEEHEVKTLVFRFSGRGQSFENFAELAHAIDRWAEKGHFRTVAYIPAEGARGMALTAVFACREIIVDKFAQLGEVIPLTAALRKKMSLSAADEQSVIKKIVSFAKAGGHNPLLAQAMADKHTILYQISRAGERKLVDQEGYQQHITEEQPPWKMVGRGPLVGSGEVLLLDGQEALEIGLAGALAGDDEELADVLGIRWFDLYSGQNQESKEQDTSEPAIKDANSIANSTEKAIFPEGTSHKAIFIVCAEMVDEGLYESIRRRTETALAGGATYIIYEMDTFGGRVDSAHNIYQYILQEVSKKAHTVAYIRTKAISAGALISVACQDIIMKENTQIGDCAPIMMGGTLEGVEREKIESPLRSFFEAAAKANGYPAALCKAMVTVAIEVYRIKNRRTGEYEYFEGDNLPRNARMYDLVGKELINTKDELLTLYADLAYKYGLARTVVEGLDEQARDEVLAYLEERDEVTFDRPAQILKTNWSEELVRMLTSPTVTGILFMVALLGIYAELNSPGVGLPGAVAVAALVVLFGSKYLIGMANWWEIAVFMIGMGLLLMEIFVIPGFGVAGISGVLLMVFALGAMMVGNPPDELPIPESPLDWELFERNLQGLMAGFIGFCVFAYFIGRYFPRLPLTSRLVLATRKDPVEVRAGGTAAPAPEPKVRVGYEGVSVSELRPSGIARFGKDRLNVVTRGELIEAGRKIKVVVIEGNSIVVKEL